MQLSRVLMAFDLIPVTRKLGISRCIGKTLSAHRGRHGLDQNIGENENQELKVERQQWE